MHLSQFSDALIVGSEGQMDGVKEKLDKLEKPFLDIQDEEGYLPAYLDFYKELLAS